PALASAIHGAQPRAASCAVSGVTAAETAKLAAATTVANIRRYVRSGLIGFTPTGSLQFARTFAEQAAGDDQQLNLLRAFEDVQDLGIPRPFLQQAVFGIGFGAAQGDAGQRRVHHHAPGLGLALRR